MIVMLPQHWTWDRSVSIPILAAVSVLLTVVLGALKLRGHRSTAKQEKPSKALFPKNRVFLVEKSSVQGCAHPCATGPLFQFDSSETHESLDFADTYRSHDGNSGSGHVTLFIPGYERAYDQREVSGHDMFAPMPDSATPAWKQQQQLQQQQRQYYLENEPPGGQPVYRYAMHEAGLDINAHPKNTDTHYGYTRAADYGEDDSDSGASIPSQNVESLELMDPLNMGPIGEGVVELSGVHQHDPFATVPSLADGPLRNMQQSNEFDSIMLPYERPLEPLDPTFTLDATPRSLLSASLRAGAAENRAPAHKRDYVIDAGNLLFDPSLPLPLSNPTYTVDSYMSPDGVNQGQHDDDSSDGLGFSHLSGPEPTEYYYSQAPPSIAGGEHYLGAADSEVRSDSVSLSGRRKPSMASPPMKSNRPAPRRKTFHLPEGVDADISVSALPQTVANEAALGSLVPSLPNTVSDIDAPSSIGSNGVSPKSPKETDGSGDDGVARYRCPHCDTTFRIRGYLTRHIKKHADVMMFNCPFFNPDDEHRCHATGGFSRRDTYKTHLKARHFLYPRGTGRKDRYRVAGNCSGCGEQFNNNEEWIENHIQTGKCAGKVFGTNTTTSISDGAEYSIRDASVDSSPKSEHEIGQRSEDYSIFSGPPPYQHDFQRHNMLMTHVQ